MTAPGEVASDAADASMSLTASFVPSSVAPGTDAIYVVAGAPVDPLSVREAQFAVVTGAGELVTPTVARLARPSLHGRTFSIILEGHFGPDAPQALRVLGPLYTVDGRRVERRALAVRPVAVPAEALGWGRVEGAQGQLTCDEGFASVAVWWSRPVGPGGEGEASATSASQRGDGAPMQVQPEGARTLTRARAAVDNTTFHCGEAAALGSTGGGVWIPWDTDVDGVPATSDAPVGVVLDESLRAPDAVSPPPDVEVQS